MPIFKLRNLNTGQATPIPPGEFTVGRDQTAYVHVEDGSVSRRHAKIFNLDDGLFVEDTGSANGTAAHGAFITSRMEIVLGDVIHIGSVPFRVDPELAGEAAVAPSAGLRMANHAHLRRDTERLPVPGETPRVVQMLSPEKLSAPEVNPADSEADELNAITILEPTAPEPIRLPIVRTGLTALSKESSTLPAKPVPAPQSLVPPKPAPAPQNLIPPKPRQDSAPLRQVTPPHPTTPPAATPRPETISPVPGPNPPGRTPAGITFTWLALTFLAGMGTGLLLGLYFAKLFLELGGKAASLP